MMLSLRSKPPGGVTPPHTFTRVFTTPNYPILIDDQGEHRPLIRVRERPPPGLCRSSARSRPRMGSEGEHYMSRRKPARGLSARLEVISRHAPPSLTGSLRQRGEHLKASALKTFRYTFLRRCHGTSATTAKVSIKSSAETPLGHQQVGAPTASPPIEVSIKRVRTVTHVRVSI